jgi:transposase
MCAYRSAKAGGRRPPGMRFVPVKSAEQQAQATVPKMRETLVDQRTVLVNTLRGHAGEFGMIAAKGLGNITLLLKAVAADTAIPSEARETTALLGEEIDRLDTRLKEMEITLVRVHKANAVSKRLATIPGVAPITALTPAFAGAGCWRSRSIRRRLNPVATSRPPPSQGQAWVGLTPRERSTGGKPRMGGISRADNERLRQLLVLGAMSVIKVAERPGNKLATEWTLNLLRRRPRKVAAVAPANKMARIAWAMMMNGEAYRRAPTARVS